MPRYIDANMLLTDLGDEPEVWTDSECEIQARNDYRDFKSFIQNAPTADVVEVVRCENCKWSRERNAYERIILVEGVLICTKSEATADGSGGVWSNHFCSYGERKE